MEAKSLATQKVAWAALKEYKAGRANFDKRDMEIARIYRHISKGEVVISVHDAIRNAGVDELGRPRLAIMRADQEFCRCELWQRDGDVTFTNMHGSHSREWHFPIPWPNRSVARTDHRSLRAALPRIPPQHRPKELSNYYILWEADWVAIPRDPMLLKRIGKDAFVVLATWDLTDVEMNVLRSHLRV